MGSGVISGARASGGMELSETFVRSSVDGVAYLNVVLEIARPRMTGEYLVTSSDSRMLAAELRKKLEIHELPKFGVIRSAWMASSSPSPINLSSTPRLLTSGPFSSQAIARICTSCSPSRARDCDVQIISCRDQTLSGNKSDMIQAP